MTLKQSPYPDVMARLIALDMPASKTFVELVQRVWSNGDAVLPIDQRLPQHGKKLLLDAMSPSEIIDASFDSSALPDGRPMQDGEALVIASSGSTGSPRASFTLIHLYLLAHKQVHLAFNSPQVIIGWFAYLFPTLVDSRSYLAPCIQGLHSRFTRTLM